MFESNETHQKNQDIESFLAFAFKVNIEQHRVAVAILIFYGKATYAFHLLVLTVLTRIAFDCVGERSDLPAVRRFDKSEYIDAAVREAVVNP